MMQTKSSIESTIDSSQYEYGIPVFRKNEKVIFKLLPFIGFDDNISYLKLPGRINVYDGNDDASQEQILLNNDYDIDNLQYSEKNDYTSDIDDGCVINKDSVFYQNLIVNKEVLNSNFNSDSDEISTPAWKKTKIHLNEKALTFKESFYQLFTFKKKFQKKYVVQIHNSMCHQIGLRRVNREESRSIDKYFQHFAPYADTIIKYIQSVPISVWAKLVPSLFKFNNNSNNLSK